MLRMGCSGHGGVVGLGVVAAVWVWWRLVPRGCCRGQQWAPQWVRGWRFGAANVVWGGLLVSAKCSGFTFSKGHSRVVVCFFVP